MYTFSSTVPTFITANILSCMRRLFTHTVNRLTYVFIFDHKTFLEDMS